MENSRTYARGYVKEWNHFEGWGIIIDEKEINYSSDNQCEYYVHYTDITGYNVPWLDKGEKVAFEIIDEDPNNKLHKYIPRDHMYINKRHKIYKNYDYHPDRQKSITIHRGYDRWFTGGDDKLIKLLPKSKRRDRKKPHKNHQIGYDTKKHRFLRQYIVDYNKKFYENWCNNYRAINVHQLNRINWEEDNPNYIEKEIEYKQNENMEIANKIDKNITNEEIENVIKYRENMRNTDRKYGQLERQKIEEKYGNKDILGKNKIDMNENELEKYENDKNEWNRKWPKGYLNDDILNVDLKKYYNWFPELID